MAAAGSRCLSSLESGMRHPLIGVFTAQHNSTGAQLEDALARIAEQVAHYFSHGRSRNEGRTMKRYLVLTPLLVFFAAATGARGQFTSSDSYTRYELLAPETHQFRIYYEVTETRPGARFHFNPIREGSVASDESVLDAATGSPLKFEVVSGAQARADVPGGDFNPTARYIKVHLAHPVPAAGECRLIIWKTYKDDKSYYSEGDLIVFKRSLSIPRNSVVLPAGFEVVSSSVATQVLAESDGRLKLAFVNAGSGGPLEVTIKARRLKKLEASQ